jgi:regulator of sigma E protease
VVSLAAGWQWLSGWEWLAVIPMLSVLVFFHELGHFLAALLVGVRVEEFGLGYPPRLLVLFEHRGVKVTLNWLPFGGFVRLAGESGEPNEPGSLVSKKGWQRFLVFASGPAMNLVVAVVLYGALFASGIPEPVGPVVVEGVAPGSPAELAGLQPGDVLLSIGEVEVRSLSAVQQATLQNLGREVTVVVERAGKRASVQVRPRTREEIPHGQGPMGVTITIGEVEGVVIQRVGLLKAAWLGVERALLLIGALAQGLGQMVLALFTRAAPVPEGALSGPVGIARLTGEVVRSGWLPFLDFTGFLSLNFALLNLLPLPALDGGRIAFVVAEWLRGGRRVPPEREALVHFIGMVALIALMLVVSYLDIVRWLQGRPILPGG